MLYKILIVVLMLLSIYTKNKNMVIASIVVLFLSFINYDKPIDFIEKHFMDWGLLLLMVWMLIPLIKMQGSLTSDLKSLFSLRGIVSFTAGIFVVLIAAKGLNFLRGGADVMTGVVLGSVIGVALLGGVPVGPMIASGIAYEVIKLIQHFMKSP